jgi:hypothetical protein
MMCPTERHSPTLWPACPNEKAPIEFAIEARAEENRLLKNLVVRLSEIILRDVTDTK